MNYLEALDNEIKIARESNSHLLTGLLLAKSLYLSLNDNSKGEEIACL